MADVDPHNQQYSSPPFGLSGDYASTGAGGSPGTSAAATAGPVVGSPAVLSGPYQSSQLPIAHVPVHSGDTSAFSDDVPVHASPLLPGDPAPYLSTGAGTGHAGHVPHPNTGS
jgi:hypothetical protein